MSMSISEKILMSQQHMDPREARLVGVLESDGSPIDIPYITEILPGLYMGAVLPGARLPDEVRHVVSLHPQAGYAVGEKQQTYLQIDVPDGPLTDPQIFDAAAEWVSYIQGTDAVLVHCQAGLNRSALVMSLVLSRNEGMPGPDAVALIRSKRSLACLSNPEFEQYALAQPGWDF